MEIDAATSSVRLVGPSLRGRCSLVQVETSLLMIPHNSNADVMVVHLPTSPVSALGSYMAELAWNPRSWDVVVVCAGEEFRGTLSILRRVPFFDAALSSGFSEGAAGRLEVADARIASSTVRLHRSLVGAFTTASERHHESRPQNSNPTALETSRPTDDDDVRARAFLNRRPRRHRSRARTAPGFYTKTRCVIA